MSPRCMRRLQCGHNRPVKRPPYRSPAAPCGRSPCLLKGLKVSGIKGLRFRVNGLQSKVSQGFLPVWALASRFLGSGACGFEGVGSTRIGKNTQELDRSVWRSLQLSINAWEAVLRNLRWSL